MKYHSIPQLTTALLNGATVFYNQLSVSLRNSLKGNVAKQFSYRPRARARVTLRSARGSK